MSVFVNFCREAAESKQWVKVYLNDRGRMLEGYVTAVDEDSIVLDRCLIERSSIVSITPPVKR